MPDVAMKLPDYLQVVKKLGKRFLFLGDGVEVHRDNLNENACFLPPHMNHLRPAAVAFLALKRPEEWVDYLRLEPLYLRAPQAERERMAKNA
jgi:Inactive homolog of metal-dependent proteases, putative molecular chaperone